MTDDSFDFVIVGAGSAGWNRFQNQQFDAGLHKLYVIFSYSFELFRAETISGTRY